MPGIAYYDYSNDQLIYKDWDYFGTEEENVLISTDSEVKFFLHKDDTLTSDLKINFTNLIRDISQGVRSQLRPV